jgi:arginyl-tRNA synthetase
MDLKSIFSKSLSNCLKGSLTKDEIHSFIEVPKHTQHGDLAFPCFQLAKIERKAPSAIAEQLAASLQAPEISNVTAIGPYVNVTFDPKTVGKEIVDTVLQKGSQYGSHTFGNSETVVLDMSSPNIAKPFSMGHLRSTVIGNSLALIANKCGYTPIRINYIGDWGTQFGKLIVAFKKWGNIDKVKENPISELFTLYKKFHKEAATNPELEAEGRRAFKLLEDGDEEITSLWKWFRDESLQAFKKIYQLLGVEFDSYHGEAFFNDKMQEVIDLLKEKQLLETSQGAEVVRLEDKALPPCLIKKSDGATLYATRDLAAALYRQSEYHFHKALYVVGQEQTIHFKQIISVLGKLGYDWANNIQHIPFGLYLKDGKKMSTRKGRVVLLEEVLLEAISMAKSNIEEKNPHLQNAEDVAKSVGVGAIIFHDLKNDRQNDIEFSLESMLTFEGETGPYIQYANARAQSILRKSGDTTFATFDGLEDAESWDIIKLLRLFPEVVEKANLASSPSYVAKYTVDLAQSFNKYYGKTRILQQDTERESRLALVNAVSIVLTEALKLLGLKAPVEM